MFIFALAKELKKTVAEIENTMDVAELMEWVAYFQVIDEKTGAKLKAEVAAEKSANDRFNEMRMFLQAIEKKKESKGV